MAEAQNVHEKAADDDESENDSTGYESDATGDENNTTGDANHNDATGGAGENGATGGANEGLNPRDLNELQKFSNLVVSRETEISNQSNRIDQMGWFGHWWDAQVPDSDRCFYNFVSLKTCTDKKSMSGKIQAYKNFYDKLKGAAAALRQAARDGNVDADQILMLYNDLSEMLENAELEKNTTNSSTLYNIHKQFIASQEPLENMIRRAECVALRQQLKQVTQAWKDARNQIDEMRHEMQGLRDDNSEIKMRLDELAATNEQMAKNQQLLLEQNEVMTKLLRDIFDKK